MGHIVHDYGIERGIEAGCQECTHKHLSDLDARNIVFVTGMPLNQWHNWLDAGPEWVFHVLNRLTAKEVMALQGRYIPIRIPRPSGQVAIVLSPKEWIEPKEDA